MGAKLKKRRSKGFRAAAARRARARRKAEAAKLRGLRAERVYLDRGGYTSSGKYFGTGAPLYHVTDDEGSVGFVRAKTSREAKHEAVVRPWHWGTRRAKL